MTPSDTSAGTGSLAPADPSAAKGAGVAGIMGGDHPGGITLGPALAFGRIAAEHLAGPGAARDTRPRAA